MAAGKVKIKEMGLPNNHPEKEGVLVDLADLVAEVQLRISRRSRLEQVAEKADGKRLVGGVRGDPVVPVPTEATAPEGLTKSTSASAKPTDDNVPVPDTEKPASESLQSQEAIGAVPAS